MWQQAFFKLAAAAGVPVDPGQGQPPPEAVIEQAQAARQRDPWVQVGCFVVCICICLHLDRTVSTVSTHV